MHSAPYLWFFFFIIFFRSGTEEKLDEKAKLLGESADLEREGTKYADTAGVSRKRALMIRQEAMATCSQNASPLTSGNLFYKIFKYSF